MLENLTYFLNGASLSFFAMGAFHMAIYARQSKSRPHYLFTICLIWMALIELKEFFLSHDAAYNYEILGPGFTFPDLFTLALLSLFFFELVMPGRITARYSLKLLSPFVLLGGAYWLGTAFEPRTVYASLPELLKDLPSFLPTYLFLLRVPLDVVHECLRLRLEQRPDRDAEPSVLSIRQVRLPLIPRP